MSKELSEVFDRASKTYDYDFSQTAIGRKYRGRVQERLDELFKPGMLVLDIGCGTGDDAIHLAKKGVRVIGCDFSSSMLEIAGRKVKKAGLSSDIELRHLHAENLFELLQELPMGFDGVYSNFGPLNLIGDMPAFVRLNARLLDPGGRSLHVVMGRKPLFEFSYFFMHRRLKRAFSRWRGCANVPIGDREISCRFYQPYEIMEFFDLYFSVDRIEALGLLIPPPYLAGHFIKRLKFYRKFFWLDRWLSRMPLFNTMGDHFIIELTRERDDIKLVS